MEASKREGGGIETHHAITPLRRQEIHRHWQNLRMVRDRTLIARLPDRHDHVWHLRKHADPAGREPKRHRRRAIVLVTVLDAEPCAVEQQAVAAGLGVIDEDVAVEPVHEDGFVGLGFREGGVGVAIAEGPAYEWSRVDKGAPTVVDGGVGGVERVAYEARLLLGDEDWVGYVQEGGEGGWGGSRFGGRPGGCEVQGRDLGFEKGFKFGEEGEDDRRGLGGGVHGEIEGLNTCGVGREEREVRVQSDAGVFPDGWITAPGKISSGRLLNQEIGKVSHKKPAVSNSGASGITPVRSTRP